MTDERVAQVIAAMKVAGVQPSAAVVAELGRGDTLSAFIDMIGIADQGKIVLPVPLVVDIREAFENLHLRPGSAFRARVGDGVARLQRVAATSAA